MYRFKDHRKLVQCVAPRQYLIGRFPGFVTGSQIIPQTFIDDLEAIIPMLCYMTTQDLVPEAVEGADRQAIDPVVLPAIF